MVTNIKGFALLITISLLLIFSFLSISIIETQTISTHIDKLKYLHLQAKIHITDITKFILTNSESEINNFKLDDLRFSVEIIQREESNNSIYNVSIQTIDDTNIRLTKSIVK